MVDFSQPENWGSDFLYPSLVFWTKNYPNRPFLTKKHFFSLVYPLKNRFFPYGKNDKNQKSRQGGTTWFFSIFLKKHFFSPTFTIPIICFKIFSERLGNLVFEKKFWKFFWKKKNLKKKFKKKLLELQKVAKKIFFSKKSKKIMWSPLVYFFDFCHFSSPNRSPTTPPLWRHFLG